MKDWRPHRMWLGLLGLALLLALASGPLLGVAQNRAAQRLAQVRAEKQQTVDALHQLQADITATEKMKDKIDMREAEKTLAPADRLRAAHIMEQRASEARLDHFTYALAPEVPTSIHTLEAGPQELALSKITLSAEAPTDTDAYIFLDALARTMPGRLSLRQVSIQRIGAAGAPIKDTNVRLTASGEWLSNRASQNLALEMK